VQVTPTTKALEDHFKNNALGILDFTALFNEKLIDPVPDLVTYATEANWQMYYMVLDKLAALGVRARE
jgi:hypothetical protein